MKKKVDQKSKPSTMEDMEETEAPDVLFEPDFGQKVEDIQKEFGSLSRFLETQKSLPDESEFVSGTVMQGAVKASRRHRSHLGRHISATSKSR